MDAHTPRHEDELSDFERHLAGWQPAPGGLDADAMLFAAGQAAGQRGRGRLLGPALCVLFAVQGAGLGAWGLSERAERLRWRAACTNAPRPRARPRRPRSPLYRNPSTHRRRMTTFTCAGGQSKTRAAGWRRCRLTDRTRPGPLQNPRSSGPANVNGLLD